MIVRTGQKGVTLIELLIVVLIIAALAAIAVPRISQSAATAKSKACRQNIAIMNTAIEQFQCDTGRYPSNLQELTQNTDYFPDGEPQCPVTGQRYPKSLLNKRVDDRLHHH